MRTHLSWEMTPVLGYVITCGRCWRKGCSFINPSAYPLVESAGLLKGFAVAKYMLGTSVSEFYISFVVAVLITYGLGVAGALAMRRIVVPR